MGRIVTVASSKGGVGKTALVTSLAARLAVQGYRTAVVDADPNLCFAAWHRLYEGPAIGCSVESRDSEIVDLLQAQARQYDVVIADTAGFNNATAAFAAGTADMVLIPVMPDRASVAEAMRTARQVENFGKAARRSIPSNVVRVRWNPKGLVERALADDIARAGLKVMSQYLSPLSEYGKVSVSGKVPAKGKISTQVDDLITELVTAAGLSKATEVA